MSNVQRQKNDRTHELVERMIRIYYHDERVEEYAFDYYGLDLTGGKIILEIDNQKITIPMKTTMAIEPVYVSKLVI